ncbi:MAG TPA: hypothetical protein PKK07_00010 [bacterium]|jgi:anionic cell wall polymer biosynthesis LytR-Cps2A-Psr (LCP) family protein|nr:hypothetical protein [bacterium]HOA18560.1 hypothetical protein [bacterium]
MDIVHVILSSLIIVLLCVLIVAVVYIIFILKELKETVKKANAVLDDVQGVTGAVSSPLVMIAGLISGAAEGLKAIKSVSGLFENKKKGGS